MKTERQCSQMRSRMTLTGCTGSENLGLQAILNISNKETAPMRRDDFLPTVATEHILTTLHCDVLQLLSKLLLALPRAREALCDNVLR
jgi:hypothetical protein